MASVGGWILTMKSSTISTLGEDYINVAKARGLKEWRILTGYVGRNALLPLVTRLAISVGFVASLDRPGGNMTGITAEAGSEMAGKRVQLLKEAVPQLSRVAVLHAQDEVNVPPQLEQIKHAATLLGITVHILSFRGPNELEAVFTRMREQHAQGLVVLPGALTFASRQKIADLALAHRLPSSHALHDAVQVGGLLSLGYNIVDLNRQVAIFVAKILKGAKPADLPVEQPTKFVLAINLKTAKALGLTIPPSLLQRADQVIE
jgi:putative ABC transport system substrate-binding protein